MQTGSPYITAEAGDKIRRIIFATANWMCGALEGLSRDNADTALAEALDSWLRFRKQQDRIFYTGQVKCMQCGYSWEDVFASDDTEIRCPKCGNPQSAPPLSLNKCRRVPENRDALEKVHREMSDTITAIVSTARTLPPTA